MDIGVSSNFEVGEPKNVTLFLLHMSPHVLTLSVPPCVIPPQRFLFHMTNDDAKAMAELMGRFEATGSLEPPPSLVEASQEQMCSASVSDDEVTSVNLP